jgi:hypothetical protein
MGVVALASVLHPRPKSAPICCSLWTRNMSGPACSLQVAATWQNHRMSEAGRNRASQVAAPLSLHLDRKQVACLTRDVRSASTKVCPTVTTGAVVRAGGAQETRTPQSVMYGSPEVLTVSADQCQNDMPLRPPGSMAPGGASRLLYRGRHSRRNISKQN